MAPGGIVVATWSGIASPHGGDWIALYAAGAPDTRQLYGYILTGGSASGTARYPVPADLPVGAYKLRLFGGGTGTRLATSNAFTLPALSASPPSLAPGGVVATWSGVVGHATPGLRHLASHPPRAWVLAISGARRQSHLLPLPLRAAAGCVH